MFSDRVRLEALDLLASGVSYSAVTGRLGVSRTTLVRWRKSGDRSPRQSRPCARCDDVTLHADAYAALLGYYLGDGHLARHARYWTLTVSCDVRYPGIIRDVESLMSMVLPTASVHQINRSGCINVQSGWTHWPCLLPQHGPGRKHTRPIVLEEWQRQLVDPRPGKLLRGLMHSDGCRVSNWATRPVAGQLKRYDYPRWQFVNHSADIRALCCWALDATGIAWRQSSWKTISVSRRDDVRRLDELIGLKD
jgi:hypothetical protein